jgi:HSP20 family protein
MFELVPFGERRELGQLRREMDNLFDRFFEGWPFRPSGDARRLPVVDVSETAKEIMVEAELPGIDPKEIEISLNKNVLNLRGERKHEEEQKGENFRRMERRYGAFSRAIVLPAEVDANKVDATYKDGILKIRMPKTKEHTVKKITVKKAG